ncbi:uncharacterized protein [Drosophila takahashii]|uniref:uncharacterized protein isoform X2 n=1 Tax=Drosophila takahashii TaxID=29030 RepID=UPI001CF81A18|nr:uncharacterized protein LOC108062639 [Drosophila takahashii]
MDQELDQKFTMELGIIEDGVPESTNLVEPDTKNNPIRIVRATLMVILLNVCLVAGTIPIYLYLNTFTEVIRERFMDFILVGGGLIAIPTLYRMGDLSKGRHNFYYI